jgi:hypothetical protein
MECREIQGLLTAYLEGALKPHQGLLVQEHLSSCEKCRCAVEDLRKTGALVKGLEEIEPPPWLTQKIMARVREDAEQKGRVWRWLFYPLRVKLPLQGVAAILIVGLAAFLYKAMTPPFEAARMPSERGQVLHLDERTPSPQREEMAARQSADGSELAKDAQQKQAEARQEAAGQFSVKERRTHEEKSIANQGPMALKMQDRSPESPEASRPAYAPLIIPEKGLPPSPEEVTPRAYRKAKAPAPRSGGVIEMKAERIDLKVRVTDIADAGKRIEKLLEEEGAHRVTRESREGRESISAEMQGDQVKALLQKLREVGDTVGTTSEIQAGETVAIRIDLLDTAKMDQDANAHGVCNAR